MKKCAICGLDITEPRRYKFCSQECHNKHESIKIKKLKDDEITEQIAIFKNRSFKRDSTQLYLQLYSWFKGENANCHVCGLTHSEQVQEYGSLLHLTCLSPIQNYRILHSDNWSFRCTGCFLSVLEMKNGARSRGV